MNELTKQKLAESGADVEGTLHRFMGNEALYLKFLAKFKDDTNFDILMTGLKEGNLEDAFRAAHTLKGVSANLGLTPIYDAASEMTELLRGKQVSQLDMEQLTVKKEALEKAYRLFIKLIEENV